MNTSDASIEAAQPTETEAPDRHDLLSAMQEELKRRKMLIQHHKNIGADESITLATQWLSEDVDITTGRPHHSSDSEYHYRIWYSKSESCDNSTEVVLSSSVRLHQWPSINRLLTAHIQKNVDHRCHSVVTFFETTKVEY